MFCKYCGVEINQDDAFCKHCGKKVIEQNENKSKTYDGKVKKCPNCGEVIEAFTTKCKACGYEFRESNPTSSIEDLKKTIEMINNTTAQDNMIATSFGLIGDRTSKIVSAIKSFNIPNTKEDIIELMFLASSNISVQGPIFGQSYTLHNEMVISDAWKSKMEQAYQKAKISLINDPALIQIEDIYNTKKNEMKSAERARNMQIILLLGFLIFICILLPLIILLKH